MGHHDDGLALGQLVAGGYQVAHEGLVDLGLADVQPLQIGQ
jgi:hypothetical protein